MCRGFDSCHDGLRVRLLRWLQDSTSDYVVLYYRDVHAYPTYWWFRYTVPRSRVGMSGYTAVFGYRIFCLPY